MWPGTPNAEASGWGKVPPLCILPAGVQGVCGVGVGVGISADSTLGSLFLGLLVTVALGPLVTC